MFHVCKGGEKKKDGDQSAGSEDCEREDHVQVAGKNENRLLYSISSKL